MNLSLRPETQRFIEGLVKTGLYPTPEAVVEAAITNMRDIDDLQLDDATIAAINQADDQADRGEGVDLDTFRAAMNKRFTRSSRAHLPQSEK